MIYVLVAGVIVVGILAGLTLASLRLASDVDDESDRLLDEQTAARHGRPWQPNVHVRKGRP